jgi:all-trans-retinol 13,14-reductase
MVTRRSTPSDFKPYKRHPVTDAFGAIVIGSGIGGLATAALLARYGGRKVLVLERHYTPGGFTHVFRRPGYEWDVGVHYIGNVRPGSMLRAVFDVVGDGGIEWADMGEVYDRIVIGGDSYDFPKGRERFRAAMKAYFPGEEAAIDAYLAALREALSGLGGFMAGKALPGAIGALAGPLLGRRTLAWAKRTTREVLEGLTRNQRLIAVLAGQFGDYGLPPAESSFLAHAMVASHYLDGAWYPVGGSGVFVDAILPVIQAAGGRLLVNAEVAGIAVEDNRVVGVRMALDGATIRAPVVVSDAGVFNTFGRLLPQDLARRHRLPQALATVRPSIAHLCLYVGFRESAQALRLPKHNIWVYPHEDPERSFAGMSGDPDAALPMAFISFPSAKDPDFERRHPGRATVDVVAFAPYAWFERWQDTHWKDRGEEYEAFKETLAQRMLETLFEQLPQLRGKVDCHELSTPLTTRHFCNYGQGEIYGIDHSPQRFRQRFLRPATPIRGLYLTGQDIVSCGVGGAMMGGVLTASAILRRNLLSAIRQSAPRRTGGESEAGATLSAEGRARA